MGVRRIQKVGKSTFTVSLPQDWVKARGIAAKAEVDVHSLPDGSLRVATLDSIKSESKQKEIVIAPKEPDAGFIIRKMLAAYVSNYDVIKLDLSKITMEPGGKEKIRKIIKNKMAGSEIIEESVNQITVQILLRPYEFPLDKLLIRMASMTHDMMADVSRGIIERERNMLLDVIERDEDIDKLYFMASRWLASMIGDQASLQNYGLSKARDCLEYSLAFRNMERIADHVNRIASNFIGVMDDVDRDLGSSLASTLDGASAVFIRSVNCLQSGSLQEANKSIHDARKIIFSAEDLMNKIVELKMKAKTIGALIIVVDSIKRIADYSIGLSETAFDLHTD
jgi:phosphate uptake regulator